MKNIRYGPSRIGDAAMQVWRALGLSLSHWRRYTLDTQYRSHAHWLRDHGEERLRYSYPLHRESIVLDVGGYRGTFAKQLIAQYGARVYIVEPVPEYANEIRATLAQVKGWHLIEGALSTTEGETDFVLAKDATSSEICNPNAPAFKVRTFEMERLLVSLGLTEVTLLKLNIEGAEFPLLRHMIERDLVCRFEHIQVQFHCDFPEAKAEYRRIARLLRRTHTCKWRYPFVWESWSRKPGKRHVFH